VGYSEAHIGAFKRWQKDGSLSISEDTVRLIEREDPATGREIRESREKHARAVTERQPQAPVSPQRWAPPRAGEDWDAYVERNKRAPVHFGVLAEVYRTLLTAAAKRFEEMADAHEEMAQRLTLLEKRQDFEARLARVERALRAFHVDGDHDDSHEVM
jgi:hypothetical protein